MATITDLFSVDEPRPSYQDGDVIVYTGRSANNIFVVHKDVLAAASPYFRSALGEHWGRYATSKTGSDSPKVYEMDLEFDLETSSALPVLRVSTIIKDSGELS